jgi:ribosomal protein L15
MVQIVRKAFFFALASLPVALADSLSYWPQQGIINIGVLNEKFNANDVITLSLLKEKGLMSSKVRRMKVLADGMLTKPLVIKSESYSIQAIKMIELTGGTVIILKD